MQQLLSAVDSAIIRMIKPGRPFLILAPFATGKTDFVKAKKDAGEAHGSHDAVDVLSLIDEVSVGEPVLKARALFFVFRVWAHRCFSKMLHKKNMKFEKYAVVLSGFMVSRLGAGYSCRRRAQLDDCQFIGAGWIAKSNGVTKEGSSKIDFSRSRVMLLDLSLYGKRAASRVDTAASIEHCKECQECLAKLVQSMTLKVFDSIDAIVEGIELGDFEEKKYSWAYGVARNDDNLPVACEHGDGFLTEASPTTVKVYNMDGKKVHEWVVLTSACAKVLCVKAASLHKVRPCQCRFTIMGLCESSAVITEETWKPFGWITRFQPVVSVQLVLKKYSDLTESDIEDIEEVD